MGALSGSVTAAAYYVGGELPSDFRDRYVSALNGRKFREIDLNSDDDESLGWVSINDPFDNEFHLDKVLVGDYLMASIRQDTIRIPAAAFKLHLRKAIIEYCKETGREKVTKAEEEELRDTLEKQLRKRVLPSIRTFDMTWNIQRGKLWLWTTNKRTNEVFQELFQDTFELPLIPKTPYAQLERMDLGEDVLDRAVVIEPAALALPRRR